MKKRILSLILCFAVAFSVIPVMSTVAFAVTQNDVVSWMNSFADEAVINDGGTQCVAVFNSYLRLFGITSPIGQYPVIYAYEIFDHPAPNGWDKISGSGNYQVGDVVVWGTNYDGTSASKSGHVGIVYSVDETSVMIFDQNYNGHKCWKHNITFESTIRGVFRPNLTDSVSQITITKPIIEVYAGTTTSNTVVYICETSKAENTDYYEVYIHDANTGERVAVNWEVYDKICSFKLPAGTYYARAVAINKELIDKGQYWMESDNSPNFTVINGNDAPIKSTIFNGNVYSLYNNRLTWNEAKAFCENKRGHLVTITSSQEQEAVFGMIEKDSQIWIGYTDEAKQGSWQWVTDETSNYSNWNEGEPNNCLSDKWGNAEHYGEILYLSERIGVWNDNIINNEANNGFICEIEGSEILKSAKKTVSYNGNTYQIFNQPLSWTEAKEYCESIGGHLVTITDTTENEFVSELVSSGSINYYWIGATDAENEGSWQWVTNEELSYSNWNEGEPNNDQGIENYAHIFLSPTGEGLWNDTINSLSDVGFICEFEKTLQEETDSEKDSDTEPVGYLKGDINGDGIVDIIDVVLARAHIVGNTVLSAEQLKRGDMNGDNTLDIIDVVIMRNNIINQSK